MRLEVPAYILENDVIVSEFLGDSVWLTRCEELFAACDVMSLTGAAGVCIL